MSRRRLLAAVSALGAALLIGRAALADDVSAPTQDFHAKQRDIADRAEAERIVAELIGDRIPRAGVVHLTAPDLAENATAVPFTIRVDCAMTADDHPVSVHLVALENPYPELSRFHFTPANGEAEVSGRCRMAASAPLVVVAKMSDGSVATTEAFVEVTGSGCG
jgi:sulfur-oxidizing protein SoxY